MHYMAWRFSFLVLYRNSFLDFEVLPDTQTIEIRPPERDPHNTIFKGFFFLGGPNIQSRFTTINLKPLL